ncbi:hypothetical protein T12_3504 [Trichinella patagoniensis]|uniref:Uncharacterized protein n=1 Tax=Trichinella patagoniensis TaxID=990121 RepID=A0A0V1AC11_9BILA|nr:hypothetical protein T12_3504 [Trichinella patagoniensis]
MFMRYGFINFSNGIINVYTRRRKFILITIVPDFYLNNIYICELSKIITSESYFRWGRPRLYIKGMPLHTLIGSCILLDIVKTLFKKVIDAISKDDQVDSPFH